MENTFNSVRDFEPRAALDAYPEGTECYEMLAPEAWRVLARGLADVGDRL